MALPPSILTKHVNWSIDIIESYLIDLINKYSNFKIPIEVEYFENLEKPLSIVAGQFLQDNEMIIHEVNYMSDTDGSEEHQMTIQYERSGFRIITPIFLMNIFHGIVVLRRYKVKLSTLPTIDFEFVKIYIIGKKFERIKNKLVNMKNVVIK